MGFPIGFKARRSSKNPLGTLGMTRTHFVLLCNRQRLRNLLSSNSLPRTSGKSKTQFPNRSQMEHQNSCTSLRSRCRNSLLWPRIHSKSLYPLVSRQRRRLCWLHLISQAQIKRTTQSTPTTRWNREKLEAKQSKCASTSQASLLPRWTWRRSKSTKTIMSI